MDIPDAEALEDQFARLLESYHDALATGQEVESVDDWAVPVDLGPRLRKVLAHLQGLCLTRITRASTRTPTIDSRPYECSPRGFTVPLSQDADALWSGPCAHFSVKGGHECH
jgi:hypothetical protein